ncbi:MAG: DEAD/DEAH box helicase family protein [Gammaproteobacteria bacterium]|jgi:type III restriction enzyme|nr:DEAD/DEAH box helicase family protein [Gammaproteobacteria bacterium]MBT3893053.1 DEAD/DEAH box helicase family protein [Gammaproteobacteria bacterium]MBT4299757.1 DEAD/DEAH box helicase family protein [Gammaproteobacteria bacterium]MBT4549157.1 DEAD/DEAH box helicase family protein [Gammaproteobacteria bacterium]MBT6479814.1 DEAD/DEAH box helicase family protein [Gammaproteobacteria bacterium]
MSRAFFEHPILNSPYEYPGQHWELDDSGQPTQKVVSKRRSAEFITPIPKPKKQKGAAKQADLVFDEGKGLSSEEQQYDHTTVINTLRLEVDKWREIPNPADWRVTPETQRLLLHWRHHDFAAIRPFFCQVEAVETAIWLTEVAPKLGKAGKRFVDHLDKANNEANRDLMRLALKLATGAGKTTVMAMLIAWQTINAVRTPNSKKFTRGFLLVAPGITIRDRLRVLLPNDPDSYYKNRELVPSDMMEELNKAKIVITNYHAFKQRERIELSKGGRRLLQGRGGSELETVETEGQMLQRVMPELMGLKRIVVINDEAHHCYREKEQSDEETLKGDDRKEAEKNKEAARLWISGIEAVNRKLGVARVFDLSATPFFLSGSGYVEGTLFPWTMSDFSLMDAIECGIVKLPRVPVAENIPGSEMPMYRKLWEHIGKKMPKKGRKNAVLDPLSIPVELQTALQALYGHYEKTYDLWKKAGIKVPPCFIVVCNNTATSKLVYDYISGFVRENEDGTSNVENGRLELFRNYDQHGNQLARPNTLLIDSEQLESGEALDKNFRNVAADEIERFKREALERGGDLANQLRAGKDIDDAALLREVMNTVGKPGTLGESIRCVVSVSMLTEGWDANTVTHVLGVRAFGTQLLCEQVIGRALRRQSYDLNEENLFNVEYADVLGIPFDFTAKPVIAPPQPPRETIQVKAILPERATLEIQFPRVAGYRVELPEERLTASFNEDSIFELTPAIVGPSHVKNSGIIGESADLTLEHIKDLRRSTLLFHITQRLLYTKWRDPGEDPKLHLFGQLKRITKEWLDTCLACKGETYPGLLMYQALADVACDRITAAITRAEQGKRPIKAVLDPYNPTGSTVHINFTTSKTERYETSSERCQINWAILDSDWEGEFCRVAEDHPKVIAYVKNHNLGLEVPYRYASENRTYRPDFIVYVDDGYGTDNPLKLIVEIKGYRGEDAKEKKSTMDTYWVPGVNNLERYGRWAFAEFTDVFQMQDDFAEKVEEEFEKMIQTVTTGAAA